MNRRSRNSLRISLPLLLLATLLLVATIGCGPSTDRLPINGQVQLDGQPLDKGSIRFSAKAGERLLSAGASIKDGEYSIPREKGLPPGEYRLEITSPSDKMVFVRTGPNDPGGMVAKDRIPESYNLRSEQFVEVTKDGDNTFDFDINSQP